MTDRTARHGRRSTASVGAMAAMFLLAPALGASRGDVRPDCRPVGARPLGLRALASAFVANEGQWPTSARFAGFAGDGIAWAEPGAFWLEYSAMDPAGSSARAVLRFSFQDVSADVHLSAERPVPGTWNYFLGQDPTRWRSELPGYAALRWTGVRPGVDFVLDWSASASELRYSFECAPGTGARPLTLRLDGAEELVIDSSGHLIARTSLGELRQGAPKAWQVDADGVRTAVDSRFELQGASEFSIDVPNRDDGLGLLVDPGLEWSAYVGGNSLDLANDMVLTAADEPIIVGATSSFDFPTTPGAFQSIDPDVGSDAFAMKISSDGTSLVYGTFLGGSNTDVAWGVSVRPDGRAVLVGKAHSSDFPVTPGALDTEFTGVESLAEAFVAELRPDGTALGFSTFLGGSKMDIADTVDVWPNGDVAVAGQTWSADFPVTSSALQTVFHGGPQPQTSADSFVARIAADGSALVAATFLGGPGYEVVTDSCLMSDDSLVVVGVSDTGGYPVTPGAFDTTYSPIQSTLFSGVVTRLTAALDGLVFSTYLDGVYETLIAGVDTNDVNIVVAGSTFAADFPTTSGALDPLFKPDTGFNGFVASFTADGSTLTYSTFLGGPGADQGGWIDVDASGTITMAGVTLADPFPATPGAFDSVVGFPGGSDTTVLRFKPDGSAYLYATLLGEQAGTEAPRAIAIDSRGRAIVVGLVTLDTFPTTPGSFDPTFGGGPSGWKEGYIAKLELQPLGVTAFGTPTPACKGPIRLTALHVPQAGNGAFAIACTGAPPGAIGVLGLSGGSQPAGIPLLGALVYLDVTQQLVLRAAAADTLGYDEIPLPIPPSAAGIRFFAQAAWLDTGGCVGGFALSASDALKIDVTGP